MDIHYLYAHAAHPSRIIDELWVEVQRPVRDRLNLRYIAAGRIADLFIPEPQAPERTDELWKTTCFEIFLRPVGSSAYIEFNFSPSSRWAAYAFDAHRAGMRDLPLAEAPVITLTVEQKRLVLDISLAVNLPAHAYDAAISAVIQDRAGPKSLWALAHPAGEPDFHDSACFAADLTAPDKA